MLEELREHNVFGGPTVWEDGHRPTEPRDGPFVRSTNHLCPSSAGWGGGGSPPPLDHSPARHSNPPFVRQRLPDQRNEWGIRAHHQSKLRRGVNLALRSRSNRTGFRLHRRRSDGGRRNVRPRVGKHTSVSEERGGVLCVQRRNEARKEEVEKISVASTFRHY